MKHFLSVHGEYIDPTALVKVFVIVGWTLYQTSRIC